MTTTEGFFDFLRGDKTISVTENVHSKKEKPVGVKENEKWILYTVNPESIDCPLDCLLVHNYFTFVKNDSLIKTQIVNCASCTPNGRLPILVAESNGHVLELPAIVETFFKIDSLLVYAAVDGLLGGYIRGDRNNSVDDVIELIESFQSSSLSDPALKVLLYSLIQASKLHLKLNDSVRLSLERNEVLSEMFIKLLESKQ